MFAKTTSRLMANSNKKSKKQILRQHIATTIAKNLLDLRETLGEKKFNRKVKKAAKLLTAGLPGKIKENKKQQQLQLPLAVSDN
jgi:hypothetical protein